MKIPLMFRSLRTLWTASLFGLVLLPHVGFAQIPIGGLAVQVSPDGKMVVAAGDNRALYLIDPETLEVLKRLPAVSTTIRATFNQDGTRLWLLDTSEKLRGYDTKTWESVGAAVDAKKFVAATGADVYACALASPAAVEVRSLTDHSVKTKVELPEGAKPTILGLDAKGKSVAVLMAPKDDPLEEKKSPPPDLKASAKTAFEHAHDAKSSEVLFIDTASGKISQPAKCGFAAPYSGATAFVADDQLVVLKSGDENVRINKDGSYTLFDIGDSSYYGADFSQDRAQIAVGSMRDGVRTDATAKGTTEFAVADIPGWPEYFKAFAFDSKGNLYGATSSYRLIKIGPDGKIIKEMNIF